MKNLILLPLLFLVFGAWGQMEPLKIVFDISSKDEATHESAMRHVVMMAAYPAAEVEVVMYGGGMTMVLKDSSTVSELIQQFEGRTNVSFKVCGETMKRNNLDQSSLLSGVKTVPDGILEIVTRQREGWGYIKEAHK